MKTVTCMAAVFVALALTSPPAQSQTNVYECVVKDMTTYDDDDRNFLQLNLAKRFLLVASNNEITVVTTHRDSSSTQKSYQVINRSSFDVMAISPSSISIDSIVLNELEYEGEYSATLVVQFATTANTWELGCGRK
jgi:hypothetical protein